MRKMLTVLSISALTLSLAGTAGAAPIIEQQNSKSPIQLYDTTIPLTVGSSYLMSGDAWIILYGENVVQLTGNKATMINPGTAQVKAFKSNGALLGVYTFRVTR
ncbi:hypothetical protein Q5741_14775 [Paenibacillus sp. JX-17]|uniref:Uncharacterized protein n=1 Tax=Paenibacillus lacisoli TaxID=3064525 RepID=A0ABT9CEK0_9BACL|nr:hypothetical protein [Paenibacillus sp. JX-17]MDO7907672.1 hypothetical protein [Paenibacillus sp. JX-17]